MPVIARFCGIVIRLLCLGSLGTRLHAFHGDQEMVIDLASLRVIQAEVPDQVKHLVLAWARAHQRELQIGCTRFLQPTASGSPRTWASVQAG